METKEIIFIATLTASCLLLGLLLLTVWKARPDDRLERVLSPREPEPEIKGPAKKSRKELWLSKRLRAYARRKKIYEKAALFCSQAGMPDKGLEEIVRSTLRNALAGTAVGSLAYLFSRNILIAVVLGLMLSSLPLLTIVSARQTRAKDFSKGFPFFLQSLGFVLQNGASLPAGFASVVGRMQPGVLKETMEGVLADSKVNGGDFAASFGTITRRVDSKDARDFAETLRNSISKGTPVAESLANQSEFLDRMQRASQNKKVNGADNKVLLPIMLMLVSLILMVVAGIRM